MVLIRNLEKIEPKRVLPHGEADATFSIISDEGGKYLQVNTYGLKGRQCKGAQDQTIRFSPEALRQLKAIIEENGL
ncbi:MAG: hypothetical protein LBI68_10815 [Azoarcus sp.]|jgi:hypothetical protein|nr:hypothetical protein [Azoarcus sp.]